jgi:hypothetical protein
MKLIFLFPLIALQFFSNHSSLHSSSIFQTDTTIIIHSLDGNIAEWPEQKFSLDETTKIHYAIDNDDKVLFLAARISDKATQRKIMQQGLQLFVDIKGKKKENHGVEFPLKTDAAASIQSMRVFGFDNAPESAQSLKAEGTINIAIAWDSSYAMNIEYYIPLKILEKSIAELNNKKISIGWKIEEPDITSNSSQPVSTTSRVVAVTSSGNRPTSNRNAGLPGNNNDIPSPSSTNKSKSFWTTHTIIF